MRCPACGRELKEDSKFCDQCGSVIVPEEDNTGANIESNFNLRFLLGGILFSILCSILISGLTHSLGIPLLFGGLFLPFFWFKRKKDN